jgi:rRNA-processing protein EBP2
MKQSKDRKGFNKVQAVVEADSDQESDANSEVDSDEELQAAFQRGELQAGLNTVLPFKKKESVNNVAGLKEKLNDIKSDLAWIERMDISNEPVEISHILSEQYGDVTLKRNSRGEVSGEEKDDKAQHDFKREMLFYRQAQGAVIEGLPRLQSLKVATKRPEDYFAQMVKSDVHMKKVREVLINKQESLEKSEKAKKQRELKKMGKQIQIEVAKSRAKDKRDMIDRVNKYKKGKTTKLDIDGPSKTGKKSGREKKLEYKNDKFGYGGQKKRSKYNTADSAADHGKGFRRGGDASSSKGPAQRPGKHRRQKLKNRKK